MSIKTKLNVVMAERNIKLKDLAEQIGIDIVNLSKLKTGKAKAIKISTLNSICHALKCQPGNILVYEDDEDLPD